MITLMSASVARKKSELNMKPTIKRQWEKIENMINEAVRAGEFKVQLEEDLFSDNITRLEKLGYCVEYTHIITESGGWAWHISW